MAAAIDGGQSYRQVAAAYGVAPATVHTLVRRLRRRQAPDTGCVTQERAGDALTVESRSSASVRTLDQLLDACEVDRDLWAVERWIANKWEVGSKLPTGGVAVTPLYQIKAWLKRQAGVAEARAIVADAIADMAAHAPRYRRPVYPTRGSDGHLLEVCLMDLHAGMYAWGEETGGGDFDSDIAHDLARRAVAALIERARGFPIERVLLPLGNDLAHADRTQDGAGGTTRKGTVVDIDGRRARVLRLVRMIAVETIDALRQIAPVDVIMIAGNHDEETILALAEIVSAWYRNDAAVTIDGSPRVRKYYRYGTTLLGFAHGHNGRVTDLPILMATEAPDDWAATTWREVHLGHLHRKGEAVQEHSGVRVRVMPSLAANDAWHATQGYCHIRAAECYLWHRETAYVGHFSVSMPGELGQTA